MKTKQKILFTLALFLLTGCSIISSSLHYTTGTNYLNEGKYQEAINELEQAVNLDPTMARNYSNLTAAYFANKELDKAWCSCRKAVLCPYKDGVCESQFKTFYQIMVVRQRLHIPGTSYEEIIDRLGLPDQQIFNSNNQIINCCYGTCLMTFKDGQLSSCSN